MRPLLITKCCGSPQHCNVFSETGEGGDYCYQCKEVKPDNLRVATDSEHDKLADMGILELVAEYNSLWANIMKTVKMADKKTDNMAD